MLREVLSSTLAGMFLFIVVAFSFAGQKEDRTSLANTYFEDLSYTESSVLREPASTPDFSSFDAGPEIGAATTATFMVTNTSNEGEGSLRQAILDANSTPGGPHNIFFAIPTSDPGYQAPSNTWWIGVTGGRDWELPPIQRPVVLDAETQGTSVTGGPAIVIYDSSFLGGIMRWGLAFAKIGDNHASGSVLRGVVLNRFLETTFGVGLYISHVSGITVENVYLGTDWDGTADYGNIYGLYMNEASYCTIRNCVVGTNDASGIIGLNSGTDYNTFAGNHIGVAPDGVGNIGNGEGGIYLRAASHNTIGGPATEDRNIIANNGYNTTYIPEGADGIFTFTGCAYNKIRGNWIGVDANEDDAGNAHSGIMIDTTGTGNVIADNVISGNGNLGATDFGAGVLLYGTRDVSITGNLIGPAPDGSSDLSQDVGIALLEGSSASSVGVSLDPSSGNTIAYQLLDGVIADADSSGNTLFANSIFSNGGLGIDLVDDGVSTGACDSYPPLVPTITQITFPGSGNLAFTGTACPGDAVEIYATDDSDPSGYGEADTWVAQTTASSSGDFTVTASDPGGVFYTATATGAYGTSEIGPATVVATSGCIIDGTPYGAGITNPENICQICNPSQSATEWTDNDGQCCDDGVFCNGVASCLGGTCQEGTPPCDVGDACDGTEACDEDTNACVPSALPCPDDGLYCNGSESCVGGLCVHTSAPCDDGVFCNGSESCEESTHSCTGDHSGDPCDPEDCCDEDADDCEAITISVDSPAPGLAYPAGASLPFSWSTTGAACIEGVDVSAQIQIGSENFSQPLATGATPAGSGLWDTPIANLDDVEIVATALRNTSTVDESGSGAFALAMPTGLSLDCNAAAGTTTLSWNGGAGDVYIQDNVYDPDFSSASVVTNVTSPWTDTGAGAANARFYRVANAGTDATGARTVGKMDITVSAGWNLLAVPLFGDQGLYASQIASQIDASGGFTLGIHRWDDSLQSWRTYDPTFPIDDFLISPGEGFFVEASVNSTWTACQRVVRDREVTLDITTGYSMVGDPTWAYALASDIVSAMLDDGAVVHEFTKWETLMGGWVTYDPTFPLFDFPLSAADGYFIKGGGTHEFLIQPFSLTMTPGSTTSMEIAFDTDVPGVSWLEWGMSAGSLTEVSVDSRGALTEDTSHTFTLDGLIPGVTYFFHIRFLGDTIPSGSGPFEFVM